MTLRVDKIGPDTVLSAMTRLLARAQLEKPRLARLADRVAAWFVAILLVVAGGVYGWWLQHSPHDAFWITLSVLVVTCPCALSLATPAALTAATGALARLGLLVTRGHALESLARVNHIVFDKTGTLTWGRLRLEEVMPLGGVRAERARAIAAALESRSEHPIARVLARSSTEKLAVEQVVATPGRGIEGVIEGHRYRIGSLRFVQEFASMAELTPHAESAGMTLVALGDKRGVIALFKLADELRPQARAAISGLRALGVRIEIMSGDGPAAVAKVANELAIDEFRWSLTPEEKLMRLKRLQEQGEVVAMVGDGVNDSLVLARAQVAIAMASGAELTRGQADIVFLAERLDHLVAGLVVARRTLAIIRQNIGRAVIYNAVALPLAAAGYVAPWMAALGMSASSVLVVLNALRLRKLPQLAQAGATAPAAPPGMPGAHWGLPLIGGKGM
ncbi:MAG: heavy metal translocating P-type ATPase [Gammaproteobacteria bacterium]